MKVENIVFRYSSADSGRPALNLELLELPRSGCHALLGPNGCGKTTLLKILAGFLVPESGRVEGNEDGVLVHQHPYLLSASVFNNVAYGLKVRRISKKEIEQRVDAELERWGLSELRNRHCMHLSGGERQRTAIARAMVLNPAILLLDEPTASIDPDNVTHMEGLIDEVIKAGTAVVFSTHHVDFAYRVADSINRMHHGRIVATPENVISGSVVDRDEGFNIFDAAGTRIHCPGRDGDFKRIVFSANDVILLREKINSSARNVLDSTVVSLEAEGQNVIVGLNCGFDFRVRVSSDSAEELKLQSGDNIYALLKSSSIRQY
ncbi:MAG: ATP-binding cassette domain-containing protein [Spirochaetales bacterium]|uniref:ATP-binding cassette domain-containing protein n=1 Tax=Candidatus Thalassospirochaeta sargassi TaxID=3119039 RepID=A0AAJ1IIK4_9SPIO|nr:ATP-binding cassette domain-containing protein [Spirochaetales bacterium]